MKERMKENIPITLKRKLVDMCNLPILINLRYANMVPDTKLKDQDLLKSNKTQNITYKKNRWNPEHYTAL